MEDARAAPAVNRRRRPRFAWLALLGAALAVVAWCGCASAVHPPRDPVDPVRIHLLSTGRHAGLLVPVGDGRTVEYGYGHWGWYALAKTDWWRAPGVVLWPGQGTLGRRYVRDTDLAASGGRYGAGTLSDFLVPRDRADQLRARLDAEFDAGGGIHFNAPYDMHFVKHPDRFWMFHDCHDEVAEWLEDLGCRVGWAPIRTGLEVREPR